MLALGGLVPLARLAPGGLQIGVDDRRDVVALPHDLALFQPDDPVATRLDLGQVVRDEEHRACFPAQLDDPVVALGPEVRIAGGQRLVDHQDLVVLGGRDGEPQPLRHPGRVGAHRVVDEVADAREVHDGLVPVLGLLRGHAHGQAAEHHVPLSGQVVEQRGVDAEQRGLPAGVDAALLGREQAGDRLQQRRLARAVPADDAHRVAVVDHERDAPDRVHLADRRAALPLDHPHEHGRRGALVAARAVDAVDHVQVVDDHGRFEAAAGADRKRPVDGALSHGRTSFPLPRRTRTRPPGPARPSRRPTATARSSLPSRGSRR